MAVTLLQTKTSSGVFANPSTVAMGNTSAKSLIIVATVDGASSSPGQLAGITDSQSNLYTKLFDIGNSNQVMTFWYSYNLIAGTTPTVSITNASGDNLSIIVREYGGIVYGSSPIDVSTSTTGNSATPNSGSITTTNPYDLVVGVFSDSWGTGQTYTVGTGYSNLTSIINNASWNVAIEDMRATTTGNYSAGVTLLNSVVWTAGIASFRAIKTNVNTVNLRPHAFSPGLAR